MESSVEDRRGRSLAEAIDTVRELGEAMRTYGLSELEIAVGELSIRLRAGSRLPEPSPANFEPAPAAAVIATASVPSPPGHVVTAPMIGTFYATPSPGQPPFVQVGDRVEVGQTIGIIEAMKIMNEIPADRTGIVDEVYVENGQAVEYGSPLIRLRLDGTG